MEEEAVHQRTHRQHPVPQHIGAFQFKLVGPFTLRQFGFFAVFGILAWLIFASKLFPLVKIPLALFFFGVGVTLAFISVSGRSFDQILIAFLKVITSPTQRIWIKKGVSPDYLQPGFGKPKVVEHALQTRTSRKILEDYLAQFKPKATSADLAEQAFLAKLDFTIGLPAKAALAVREVKNGKAEEVQTLPGITQEERKSTKEAIIPLASSASWIERPVITVPTPTLGPTILPTIGQVKVRRLKSQPTADESSLKIRGEKKLEISPQLKTMLGLKTPRVKEEEKERAEKKEGKVVKEEVETEKGEVIQAKVLSVPPIVSPAAPNLISGIVKDSASHLLEGVILIVKNENNTPVRALKTNLLGQFSISTPLQNGKYSIHPEKESYKFSIIEFEAKGEVIKPIEIVAKS